MENPPTNLLKTPSLYRWAGHHLNKNIFLCVHLSVSPSVKLVCFFALPLPPPCISVPPPPPLCLYVSFSPCAFLYPPFPPVCFCALLLLLRVSMSYTPLAIFSLSCPCVLCLWLYYYYYTILCVFIWPNPISPFCTMSSFLYSLMKTSLNFFLLSG